MQIILTQDVDNLGLAGQVVNVAKGYARNYLEPARLALPATESNLKAMAKKRAEFELRSLKEKERAQAVKTQLDELRLTLARKVGERDKLYGAVTAIDITEAAAAAGMEIDRKRLKLGEPIKSLGEYLVPLRLHPEVTASIKVIVVAENASPETGAAGNAAPPAA